MCGVSPAISRWGRSPRSRSCRRRWQPFVRAATFSFVLLIAVVASLTPESLCPAATPNHSVLFLVRPSMPYPQCFNVRVPLHVRQLPTVAPVLRVSKNAWDFKRLWIRHRCRRCRRVTWRASSSSWRLTRRFPVGNEFQRPLWIESVAVVATRQAPVVAAHSLKLQSALAAPHLLPLAPCVMFLHFRCGPPKQIADLFGQIRVA